MAHDSIDCIHMNNARNMGSRAYSGIRRFQPLRSHDFAPALLRKTFLFLPHL